MRDFADKSCGKWVYLWWLNDWYYIEDWYKDFYMPVCGGYAKKAKSLTRESKAFCWNENRLTTSRTNLHCRHLP